MTAEGIHFADEIQAGHQLLHSQHVRISPLAGGVGGGGSEWDDSRWSLSCTESEDQSSETNVSLSETPRSLPSETSSKVVLRKQPDLVRRHLQKSKTLGCYPPLTYPRSPSSSPISTTNRLTTYGVPAAIGLDCYELRRRSRNADISTKWGYHVPRADNALESTVSNVESEPHRKCRRKTSGRIQSLNRYSNSHDDREACQLSWENLKTKPPRPPTTSHSSTTASPPRIMSSESEGRTQSSSQDPLQMNLAAPQMAPSRRRRKSALLKQFSAPETSQSGNNRPPKISPQLSISGFCDEPIPVHIQETRAPVTYQCEVSSPQEIPILHVPLMPFAMTVHTSPPPVKIMDEYSVRNTQSCQKQTRIPDLRLSQGSTITLYELMQFSNICTTYIPPLSLNDPLRRNSWEIGELIPGLGIKVSVVSVTYSRNSRLLPMWNEICGHRGVHQTPGSAFSPVAGGPSQNAPAEPLLLVIDGTSVAGSKYFHPGQIILELNGVNFFSVPVTSKQGLLTRLIAAVFNAYNNRDGSLFLTLATPYPHLVNRVANETIKIRFNEQ